MQNLFSRILFSFSRWLLVCGSRVPVFSTSRTAYCLKKLQALPLPTPSATIQALRQQSPQIDSSRISLHLSTLFLRL